MAKWMWYPGDYECYHSLLLHGRRDEYDWKHPAFWRLDDCWHSVVFWKDLNNEKELKLNVLLHGIGHIILDDVPMTAGEVTIPAGSRWIQIWVPKKGLAVPRHRPWSVVANTRRPWL